MHALLRHCTISSIECKHAVYVVFPSVPCGAGPCRLTLELVSEAVATPQMSSLYPFNALRNHALLLVKTEVWTCTL